MLERAVRAGAALLHVPGQGDWRVIGPALVEAMAVEHSPPRWQVEAASLELVLAGLQDDLGQATTILPGDPGVPLIYQADHPYLERSRPGSRLADGCQGKIAGTWLAGQVIALRLRLGELLQNRLLYADMQSGDMQTFPLGR